VNHLTKNEQFVLAVFFGLLLLGLAVKWYRQAHPPVIPLTVSPAKP
jgi:Mlc titration factor MtfA (ptsG expression regulator)